MATFPILDGFQQDKVIGYVTLKDEAILPLPDWHLAMGFKVLNVELDERFKDGILITKYEPYCFSIVSDDNFKAANVLRQSERDSKSC